MNGIVTPKRVPVRYEITTAPVLGNETGGRFEFRGQGTENIFCGYGSNIGTAASELAAVASIIMDGLKIGDPANRAAFLR